MSHLRKHLQDVETIDKNDNTMPMLCHGHLILQPDKWTHGATSRRASAVSAGVITKTKLEVSQSRRRPLVREGLLLVESTY